MADNRIIEDEGIMVSIRCITYNQAPYIRQCLDGFVMQKTNFRFQAVVHDDASTDGTTGIVKEYADKYPEIIIPMYEEENRWSKHDGTLLTIMLPLLTGKYICECEGDDYWTDPYKLQKQVDYLEAHPECNMVYTNVKVYLQEGECLVDSWVKETDFDDMLKDNRICSPAVCLRKSVYYAFWNDMFKNKKHWAMSDYPLWLYCFANGSPFFLNECTSVYRVLVNSVSHFTDFRKREKFIVSSYDLRLYYAARYGRQNLLKDIAISKVECIINEADNNRSRTLTWFTPIFLRYHITNVKLYILALLSHSRGLYLLYKKFSQLKKKICDRSSKQIN